MEKSELKAKKHVEKTIKSIDWDAIAASIGDPCKGCPGKDSYCYQCPIWGLLLDLARLRLLRKISG